MRRQRGPRLEIDEPTAEEREWIFAALGRPEIHRPLSLPRAPTREEFDARRLPLVEREGSDPVDHVEDLIVRERADGRPRAFLLHYGWESWFDGIRELDLAVPEPGPRPATLLVEAHLLGAMAVFADERARRLRWRASCEGGGAPRWYLRLGARSLGRITEPEPATGRPVEKEVFEMTRPEFEALLARLGVAPGRDLADAAEPPWRAIHP